MLDTLIEAHDCSTWIPFSEREPKAEDKFVALVNSGNDTVFPIMATGKFLKHKDGKVYCSDFEAEKWSLIPKW